MNNMLMQALTMLSGTSLDDTPRRRPKLKQFTDEDQRRLEAAKAKRARRIARNSTNSRLDAAE